MMENLQKLAQDYFEEAYRRQMSGDLEEAERLYKQSIEIHPTAEAYTFLGWAYSFMGRYDDAITECRKAIVVDPDYGNPYNDIGAYLIEKGQLDEAVPWLRKATAAKRYECHCYPHFNLGRIWQMKGNWPAAADAFESALRANPAYAPAKKALGQLKALYN